AVRISFVEACCCFWVGCWIFLLEIPSRAQSTLHTAASSLPSAVRSLPDSVLPLQTPSQHITGSTLPMVYHLPGAEIYKGHRKLTSCTTGFFYLFMSLLSFLFLIASLRTNLCLITIFLA